MNKCKTFYPMLIVTVLCTYCRATTDNIMPSNDISQESSTEQALTTNQTTDASQQKVSDGCRLKLIKKHGWSALTGILLGTISGAVTAITNSMFDKNGYSNYNFPLFFVLKCIILNAIYQDTNQSGIDFDMRTALATLFMSNLTVYSCCTNK